MPIVRKIAAPTSAPQPTPSPHVTSSSEPVAKRTRDQAIDSLLARGLTMEEIQVEEELAAINHALKCVRERYRTLTPRPLSTPHPVPQPPTAPATRQSFRIRNWREYNHALRQRANLTLWVDDAAIQSWCDNQRLGQVGRPTIYGDTAIQTFLMLKSVFHLPLRQTQGFVGSIFGLLGVSLPVPDYSTVCRRARTLSVALPARRTRDPVHVVIDSTGLKVFGEGEWKVREHGWSKRRTWRKLHLAIDERTGEILAEVTTTADVGDCECLPTLLEAIDETIGQVSADGAYDTVACHQAIERRQARAAIPPRANAVVNDTGWWNAREDAVRHVLKYGLVDWKRTSGYHRRSLAETMMFRMKAIFGDRLAARTLERQHTETRIRCLALNRMTSLGMPCSERLLSA